MCVQLCFCLRVSVFCLLDFLLDSSGRFGQLFICGLRNWKPFFLYFNCLFPLFLRQQTLKNRCHEQSPSSNVRLYINNPSQVFFTFFSFEFFVSSFPREIFRYEIIGLQSAAETYNTTVPSIWWERWAENKCDFETENMMRKSSWSHNKGSSVPCLLWEKWETKNVIFDKKMWEKHVYHCPMYFIRKKKKP